MKRVAGSILLGILGYTTVAVAQLPQATDTPGHPFYLKSKMLIGGEGNWDYLTLDPNALQLFVAHGTSVQVVDIHAGSVMGKISGFRDAHGIALDDSGQFGYVSDGPSNQVKVFNRSSLEVVATIPTGPNPRAIVFDPATRLVFAICTEPLGDDAALAVTTGKTGDQKPNSAASRQGLPHAAGNGLIKSVVTVIDADTQSAIGNLLLPGRLGFAQADGKGQVFVNIVDRNQIAHFDTPSLDTRFRNPVKPHPATAAPSVKSATQSAQSQGSSGPAGSASTGNVAGQASGDPKKSAPLPSVDLTGDPRFPEIAANRVPAFNLGAACTEPTAMAIDGNHQRLFAACRNMKMEVLDANSGQQVATLPIGPGTEGIGFDADRGLIYAANGGGDGSVTIIRQDVTDTYAVIQQLPTMRRARTLAVNSVSGEVYLVTNQVGVDLAKQGGIGTLQMVPVKGSFEVLVVGN